MTTITLTTELEAVNVLLSAADEAPVNSLAVTGLLPLDRAIAVLDETSRLVQSRGWAFNTDTDYPLSLDGSNQLPLPSDTLKFDPNPEFVDYKAKARGLKLYNGKDHNWTFDKAFEGTLTRLLPWTELPQAARHYIAIKAARTFQGRDLGSDTNDRFTADDELRALLALQEYESDTGNYNMLRDSASAGFTVHAYEGEGY